ncbi:MAG: hypothetical protein ACFB51_15455 [Anaerolineae bacterium]
MLQKRVFPDFHSRLQWVTDRTDSYKIIIGAGGHAQRGWVRSEIDELNLLEEADWAKYFEPGQIDAMVAEHVWEHLTREQGLAAARRCCQYLKPGGHLRIAVPDGLHPEAAYIEWVKIDGVGPMADDHKVLYTYRTLSDLVKEAGLVPRLLEYWDEDGVFHQNPWDPDDGYISRTPRFDYRRRHGIEQYTSLLIDAVKPLSGKDISNGAASSNR